MLRFKLKDGSKTYWPVGALLAIVLLSALAWTGLRSYAGHHPEKFCFYGHINEAIKINRERGKYYSSVTDGLTEPVSEALIRQEKKIIPWALLADLRAQRFMDNGLSVICGDFVSMDDIDAQATRVETMNIASDQIVKDIKDLLAQSRTVISASIEKGDHQSAARGLYGQLLKIEAIEEVNGMKFCLAKHVIESVGLAVLHADEHRLKHGKEIEPFLNYFLTIKSQGLNDFPVELDNMAQKAHILGAGIICNDVPPIPFKKEWETNN